MINKRKHKKHLIIESSFEFTVSSKNKPIQLAAGHEFYFKRKNKFTEKENWVCSKYQIHKCRATAVSENNELIETREEHNHDISAGKSEAQNVIKHKKDLSERFTPTVAVASAVLPITNNLATQFVLPSKDKLIRTAARTRKQLDVSMPPITVARNFEIPENFENFIRYDSGSNDHERIILCGDPEMLRVLEKSSFWLADGTFKITPKRFYQLYSIHVSVSDIAPACIYAFLPNKTETIYNRFLQALIDLAPNCRPEKILFDFEQAALQSFQKTFPEAHLSGCFFHLSQSYMRKVKELGLKVTYETNHDLALALKSLPSLAFEKKDRRFL